MEQRRQFQRNFSTPVFLFAYITIFVLNSFGFGALDISPAEDFLISGPEGGPFEPVQQVYELTNTGETSIYWGLGENADWIDCTPEWGLLPQNASVEVTVSVNASADSLPAGQYSEDITFTDINNEADYTRSVLLTIESNISGPVGWWKLDGDATDSSGNGYDGTVHGDPNWIDEGKDGGAVQFDGLEDYIESPFILNPADGSFSAFAWLKGGSENQKIICQTDGSGIGRNWLQLDAEIYCGYPEGRLVTNISEPDNFSPLTTDIRWDPGEWHHVGVTWDGHRRRLYIDAQEVAADVQALSGLESCDGSLYIGTHKFLDVGKFWDGMIDEVKIYDRALSAAEIAELIGIGPLVISPAESFDSSGEPGGPFAPDYKDYTIKNLSEQTLYWGIDELPAWVDVSNSFGGLDPNESTTVRVFLTEAADALLEGFYTAPVTITNLSTVQDPIVRDVNLDIQTYHGIWVSPERFDLTLTEGTQQQEILTVGNDGVQTLNFSLRTRTVSGSASMLTEQSGSVSLPAPPQKMVINVQEALTYDYKPGQVLVRFAPGKNRVYPSRSEQQDKLSDLPAGISIVKEFQFVPGLSLVQLPETVDMEEALKSFNLRGDVLYAQPNYRVDADTTFPNDARFGDLWGLHNTGQSGGTPDADIDAPEAWSISTGTGSVVVAVIDTGIDYTHEDLAGNMWINEAEYYGSGGVDDDGNGYVDDIYGYDFCNDDPNPMDDHYHGTHCAGTIGGVGNNGKGVTGVCWDVQIMALKFLDAGGHGWTDDAIQCVNYATMMGAKVMNNSWGGGGYSQALKDAIDAAGAAGIAFVAAAGNDSVNNDVYPHYPSSYASSNLIAVAATDRYNSRSNFSNYGPTSVDLGAPGSNILSCEPGNRYQYLSGTSMATPHVAGACALLWSINPMLSVSEVKDILLNTVDPISGLAGKCVSGGRLNLNNAVLETSTPWISFDIEQGQIEPDGFVEIQVTFDTVGLQPGQYHAEIMVISDDPVHPQVTIPVSLTVLPDPLKVTPETLFDPNGFEGGPFVPDTITYTLENTGQVDLDWSAQWQVDWLDVEPVSGILTPGQTVDVVVSINSVTELLGADLYEDTLLINNLTVGSIHQRAVSLSVRPPDKFTQAFKNGNFDLGYYSLLLRPDRASSYYVSCIEKESISDYPSDPAGGTYLSLGDDDFSEVLLADGKQFDFYGQLYDRVYVGSNGYVTFGQGDESYDAVLENHFPFPRISALFSDLTPANDESISYLQTGDRFVVTYHQVPVYGDKTRVNSFQIELFFADGAVRLSYLNIAAHAAIVGLSDGLGLPRFFVESDLSSYLSCCDCGDMDGNSAVELADVCEFALGWMEGECVSPYWCGRNDFDRSGLVDMADYSMLSQNWQQARYDWSEPEFLLELNGKDWSTPQYLSELDDDQDNKAKAPCLSRDRLSMFFSRYIPSLGHGCIVQATRTVPYGPFTEEKILTELAPHGMIVSSPWISQDGQRLYYHESLNLDPVETILRMAEWSESTQQWIPAVKTFNELHFGPGYAEALVSLTADELNIFWQSTRPDGTGAFDIWTASRTSIDQSFEDIHELSEVNTLNNDGGPCISPDGLTLYFNSMYRVGGDETSTGIYRTTRSSLSESFGNAELVDFPGYDTNIKWECHPYVDFERNTLYFQNTDAGGIWMTEFGPDTVGDPAMMPYVTSDELTIYFVRTIPALGYTRILEASRQNTDEPFKNERILTELAATGYNVSGPWLSEDGLRMYYHENDGTYADVKMAARSDLNSSWVPTKVFGELKGDVSAASPALSADELIIVYQSSSSGSIYGNSVNIWMGVRGTTDAPFTEIRPLDEINSLYHDGDPHLTPDGLTIFYEVKDENQDYNIYKATRNSVNEPFGSVERISMDVGTATSQACVMPGGKKIYFQDSDGFNNGLWFSEWIKQQTPCVPR